MGMNSEFLCLFFVCLCFCFVILYLYFCGCFCWLFDLIFSYFVLASFTSKLKLPTVAFSGFSPERRDCMRICAYALSYFYSSPFTIKILANKQTYSEICQRFKMEFSVKNSWWLSAKRKVQYSTPGECFCFFQ